jgi:hypothetical protein
MEELKEGNPNRMFETLIPSKRNKNWQKQKN